MDFHFVCQKVSSAAVCVYRMNLMAVDIGKPSTWINFRPSFCQDCRAGCCSLPVEVTIGDLLRLGFVAEEETQGSLKKVARRLVTQRIVHSFRAASGLCILAQSPSGQGVFLQHQRCTVYETRPDVCRQFPNELGPRVGFCPYQKKSGLTSVSES